LKVLFDEDVPQKLARSLPRHEIHTVVGMEWGGIKNGELLTLIERERVSSSLHDSVTKWLCAFKSQFSQPPRR